LTHICQPPRDFWPSLEGAINGAYIPGSERMSSTFNSTRTLPRVRSPMKPVEPQGPGSHLGLLLVSFTAILSGVATFVNSFAVSGTTSSDAFVTVRNVVVALLLVPLVFVIPAAQRRLSAVDWGRLAVIGLVGGAVPFLLFFHGLQLAGPGSATASFAYRTLFLMAAVLGLVVLRERLSSRLAVAAVLLLGGNALLLSWTGPLWNPGVLFVLAATALWAVEYTLSKRALRDLPLSTVALGRMGFGGVFLLAYLAATNQFGAAAGLTGGQFGWVLVSALLLVGFVATWYAGLKYVDLSTAAAVLVLAFPITWTLSVLAGKTAFGVPQAAGAAVVAFGVCVAIGLTSFRSSLEHAVRLLAAGGRAA